MVTVLGCDRGISPVEFEEREGGRCVVSPLSSISRCGIVDTPAAEKTSVRRTMPVTMDAMVV